MSFSSWKTEAKGATCGNGDAEHADSWFHASAIPLQHGLKFPEMP